MKLIDSSDFVCRKFNSTDYELYGATSCRVFVKKKIYFTRQT